MKKIYTLIFVLFIVILSACQADEDKVAQQTGYLRLNIGQNNSVETKAEETYNPKMFSVKILDEKGQQYGSVIEDVSESVAKEIPLKVGSYTVQVYSANYDEGAGFGKAYYSGSTKVTIEGGKTTQASVTCTLANVMVTVRFSDDFKKKFEGRDFSVQVSSQTQDAFTPLNFSLAKEGEKAYIPVGAFQATISIPKPEGQSGNYTLTNKFDDVKAKQHYAITYKLQEEGTGDFTVKYDPSTNSFDYDFYLTTNPTNQATLTASAWSRLAYLKAENVTAESGTDISILKFQYKLKTAGDEAWADVTTEKKGETGHETYEAKITGLTANTTYQYRLVNEDGSFETTASEFTTETETPLPNGNFNDWWRQEDKNSSPWYAIASGDATSFDSNKMLFSFWDSGNGGTVTMSKNPTSPEETEVHTQGGKSAKLQSQFVGLFSLGKFAAGNIFSGHFCSANMNTYQAKINFGQPFTSRPTQLKGWFKYNRGTNVDYPKDGGEYKTILQQAGGDLCGIYIALTDNEGFDYEGHRYAYEINGDLSGDDPDNFKYKSAIDFSENNEHIIAYGTITDEEAKGTGEWQEFTINLEYRDLTRQPKYIIVVASASKYGDYFTGSTSSVMYLDDFELVYDGEPTMWK